MLNMKKKMINVATSMISAIEQFHSSEKNAHATDRISDCNNVFQQKDTISCQRDSAQRPNVQRRDSVSLVPATRARGQTAAQNIPVVIGVSRKEGTNYGIQRDSNTSDLPSSESHRRPTQQSASRNECVVMGPSLVSGLGSKLCSEGVKATSYPHRGATIPQIRENVKGILPKDSKPKSVVLLCGGNDSERYHSSDVSVQYDALINDVRKRCPSVPIVLCKVPQRPCNERTARNIKDLNAFLDTKATNDLTITTVEICPNHPWLYKRDKVHFNGRGIKLAARRLAGHISANFSTQGRTTRWWPTLMSYRATHLLAWTTKTFGEIMWFTNPRAMGIAYCIPS